MNFRLSLVYTALFAGISISALAETQHKANTETIEQINVQDTGIKQNGYQTQGHPSYQKPKCLHSTRQTQSIFFRPNY